MRRLLRAAQLSALAALAALPFDDEILSALCRPADHPLSTIALACDGPLSFIALLLTPLIAALAFCLFPAQKGRAIALLLAATATPLCVQGLKRLIARPRPDFAHVEGGGEALQSLIGRTDSFPSGHAATATLLALAIAMWFRHRSALWLCLVGIALPMAWSRLALGVHRPSEVCAGVAVALLLAATAERGAGILARVAQHPAFAPGSLFLALGLTAASSAPIRARDPLSLEVLPKIVSEPHPLRTVFEPFFGPPLEVLRYEDPKALVLSSLVFVAGALALSLLVALQRRERAFWKRPAFVLVLPLLWGALFVGAPLPEDRWRATEGSLIDLHRHADDPVDGADSVASVLARVRSRGLAAIAITNHDAPPPVPTGIGGMEWSGGRHGEETFLHLLILGGDGAIQAALDVFVPPLKTIAPEETHRIVQEAIAAAKARGALVIAAHHQKTEHAMRKRGTEAHLPSLSQLIAMGIDGFEVANREPPRKSRRAVYAATGGPSDGLLRIATSDDHGFPANSPCATWIPLSRGDQSESEFGRAVLAHLRARGEHRAVVFTGARVPDRVPALLAAPFAFFNSARAWTPWQRLSVFLWGLFAIFAWRRFGPTDADPKRPQASG